MTKKPNIVVVGVGALGSHFVLLGRSLAADLTIIDFDKIERKNVLAQFHTNMTVGRNKAQALQQSMQGLFGVKLTSYPHKLTGDNADVLLSKADLLVDCLDNQAARKVVQDYSRKHGIPCLHGGLAADGTFARLVWDEHFIIDAEDELGGATCEDGEHLPFFAVTAGFMALAVRDYLSKGVRASWQLTPTTLVRVA